MRLEPERLPDPVHGGLVQPDLGGHRTRRPMRRIARRGLQGLDDHLLGLGVGDLSRQPRSRLIGQALQAVLGKAIAPPAYRTDRHTESPSISVLFGPSAAANTIRDRNASACALERRRSHASNCARSSSVNTMRVGTGLGMTHPFPTRLGSIHQDTSATTAALLSAMARSAPFARRGRERSRPGLSSRGARIVRDTRVPLD
jgi:hypothetical protein